MNSDDKLQKIVSLAKRRGFIYPGSDVHGGLAGFWDYGPYGVLLKRRILNLWWRMFVADHEDMHGVDAAIVMRREIWEESGHAEGFTDPMDDGSRFNTMFETTVGVGEGAHKTFLRPETAQGIFENFKNVVDSLHPKLPFGIAQIGKAFRNEISPRDFLFRTREFTQMEAEYFVREEEWETHFEKWQEDMRNWIQAVGLSPEHVHEVEVPGEERAHYSKRTIDFEYDFPHGRGELYGLAYRGDFDLKSHGVSYTDDDGNVFVPHVIEPSLGLERTVLAVLSESYTEDELGGEPRVYLKLKPALAPVKVAVFPLLRNKPELVKKAREIYKNLRGSNMTAVFDDNGNIGKRYRRQDEIGTPHCITVDFDTLENDTVTVRDRDTGRQKRIAVDEIIKYLEENMTE